MKRPLESESEPELESENVSKRRRLDNNFHPASGVHNFMLNDPVIDWIKFKKKSGPSEVEEFNQFDEETIVETNHFFDFIAAKGKEFEKNVIELLRTKLGKEKKSKKDPKMKMVTIAYSRDDIFNIEKYEETKEAIEDQIAVIYQGVLHGNQQFKAFGSPDLLIRSDVVKYLIDIPIDEIAPRADGKYYYVVVDVKFCTLKLKVDGKFLCNDARMPANKGQVMVYNKLLGIAQGLIPNYCYILGRGWKYSKKNEYFECGRCDERLGCIDVNGKDAFYKDKITKALEWLDKVNDYGHTWNTNPPTVPELYPNMCNKYDNGNRTKRNIATEIEEITQLWYAGVKHRERAHSQGIFKLSDPRLNVEVLGFPEGTPRTAIIDKMLRFNQGIIGRDRKVLPRYIDNNPYDWQRPSSVEFFLDFEIFSNIFDDFANLPNMGGASADYDSDDKGIVFMIGLGVSIRNEGKVGWEYYNFRVPALTNEYEFQIFDQMYNKMDDICNFYEMEVTDANIYHWGTIEQTILDRIYKKYEDRHDWEPLCLVDFNKIFQDEIILVKGVYSFGLKAVGKGLIKHELISIPDWDPDVSDGLDAMIQAYKVYNEPDSDNEVIIKKLIKYNHTDVRMIEKIINYLRLNHTPGIVRGATNSLNNFINNLLT